MTAPEAAGFDSQTAPQLGTIGVMNCCLLINPTHHWEDTVHQAWLLASAMRQQEVGVHSVFFYGDAVRVINTRAADDWLALQQQSSCRLLLCRTMMEQFDLPATQPAGFEVVGMASLASAMEQTERTVEVG